MRIGFFGTPEISAYYLERLLGTSEVAFAVTGEDKAKGRHGTPAGSPVKDTALKKGIAVLQPDNLLDKTFLKEIADKKADIFVVVAYGKIIPAEVFNLPPLKSVNVHPSLLPKYRGAAPVEWAIIKGEKETGITIQYINEKLDSGDVLLQKTIPLDVDMTAEDLYKIVLPDGFDLLKEALDQLAAGKASPKKQNGAEATYCGKINRESAHIDWKKSSSEIHNLVRGLNPKPFAWTELRGKNIKICKTRIIHDFDSELKPGFLAGTGKRLLAGTGEGCLEILELQPETKKRMDGLSFLNGFRLNEGDHFLTAY